MDMEKKTISLNENNVHVLRNNLEKRLAQSDMRKKLIGGISEEDVSIYVGSIKHQYQLIENELNKQIDELHASKAEMKRDFENFKRISGEDKTRLQESMENAIADSSKYMDKCNEKDEVINKMNEGFNLQINKLASENLRFENEIENLSKQLLSYKKDIEIKNRLESKVEELEKQLNESRKSTDNKASGFKNEIDTIYNQLVSLKTQMDINDNLQQQLENEHIRSDNAEMEISRLKEWVSGLKNKFKSEKNRLEAQSVKIEDKYNAIQSDFKCMRTVFEDFCMNTDMEIDNLFVALEKSGLINS